MGAGHHNLKLEFLSKILKINQEKNYGNNDRRHRDEFGWHVFPVDYKSGFHVKLDLKMDELKEGKNGNHICCKNK